MSLLSGVNGFFGLDIGAKSIRVVQLKENGKQKELVKYAYVPIDPKISLSDLPADQAKLMKIVSDLIAQAKLTTKNVAVGIPSQRVFTAVADIDRVPADELAKAIKFQADAFIPTSVSESKIDWALLGDSPADKTKQEILLSSIPNSYIESRLDMLESIGLNVIAFEPNNLAMARALVSADSTLPQLVIDIGSQSTDLVITLGGMPHLTRSIPTGVDAIVRSAMQNLNIDEKQAAQFVFKFGMSKDKLEGQVYQAISTTVDSLIHEIDKSIKYFQTRYTGAKLDRMIVSGGASVIPELPLYFANKSGLNVEIGNSWRNVAFERDRQNELLAISSQFAVAVGLAERHE